MKKLICAILVLFICSAGLFAQQSAGLAFAGTPIITTSVGQSADVEMVNVLLNRQRVQFTTNALIASGQLTQAQSNGTLVLVVGGSNKGLGAAGISADDELARTSALINQARTLNMSVIAVHVGGMDRRGPLSDRFIGYVVPRADYVIVVADGNTDGRFNNLAGQGVQVTEVPRISEVGRPLAAAFR